MDNSLERELRSNGQQIDLYATPRETRFEECSFYHHMDLPGVGEVGSGWDLRPTVDAYLGNLDFRGKRVLDVGAASGFLTFEMEARGAEVVSFDMAHGSQWNVVPYYDGRYETRKMLGEAPLMYQAVQNAYWFAHRALGSSARAFYGDLYALPESLGSFDIAIVGMILPHLRDPFGALHSVSKRCSETLVITQPCIKSKDPFALFLPNPANDPHDTESYFAWWVLSERCLQNMLEVLGFEVQAVIRAKHRCTSRATKPASGRRLWRRRRSSGTEEECSTIVATRPASS